MRPDPNWQRAVLLMQQQRWPMAIQELRGLLAQQPEHAHAHALLAIALTATEEFAAGGEEARQAIALEPDSDFAHRALAIALHGERRFDEAAAAIGTAIALQPDDVDHHSTLAQIRLSQRRWADALSAADQGLTLDPHDIDCLNLRAIALSKLGRGGEATDTVDASLARDPDNPLTHQARGWALLHRGDHKGALHHFQEALRRDPSLDGARAGLVEALKARNPLYRLVLGWFLWLDGKAHGHQMAILIGAWLVARFGSSALHDAGFATAATVVSWSWLGVVLLTSCAVPLFNLLLLLHPVGRHALEPTARKHALLLGATMLAGAACGVWAWFSASGAVAVGCLFWLFYLLPISALGLFHGGWSRVVLQAFCVLALVYWAWWMVHILHLEATPDVPDTSQQWRSAGTVSAARKALIREHVAQYRLLLQAVAYSTWFVLLAPKGQPRRRRRG